MPFLAHKAMIASMILLLSYLFLFTEKLNRAVVVLLGAGTMILFGI